MKVKEIEAKKANIAVLRSFMPICWEINNERKKKKKKRKKHLIQQESSKMQSSDPPCNIPSTTQPKPQPREGRCRFYMVRKQRFCTVILDGRALREEWQYCHDHKLLVDAAGGVAPSPTVCNNNEKNKKGNDPSAIASDDRPHGDSTRGDANQRLGGGGDLTVHVHVGTEDERIPCPFGNLHTIRKANYWQHLKVCPHRPSPSVVHCTRVDCNIADPSRRRATGEKRPLFAELAEVERISFLSWVEERYKTLRIESSIIRLPFNRAQAGESLAQHDSPFTASEYVRPSLREYVSNGKEKEARQHVALVNIADVAFFGPRRSGSAHDQTSSFLSRLVAADAMRERAESIEASPCEHIPCVQSVKLVVGTTPEAESEEGNGKSVCVEAVVDAAKGGMGTCFVEYGAGKGGLVAAMRMAWPLSSTIVVDRDMFRDMKDASLQKGGAAIRGPEKNRAASKRQRTSPGEHGVDDTPKLCPALASSEEVDRAFFHFARATIAHTRLKMDCKDFDLDSCLSGIADGKVETTLSPTPAGTSRACNKKVAASSVNIEVAANNFNSQTEGQQRCIAIGKHLCGGCTDMALRSVVESKETDIGGILIATCCHHMCSADTYVFPELFVAGSSSSSSMTYQHLIDCCCGTAGWGISGSAIDEDRRRLGRMVKRLLDYGRVQYLKRAVHPQSKRPLFSFVGMVTYIDSDVTEENEVLVAIPSDISV